LSTNEIAIPTCVPAATCVFEAIVFTDEVPLELLYFQVSPTVVGNGADPVDVTTDDCEAELVAAALEAAEVAPEDAAADVAELVPAADGLLDGPHPVRTRPAAAAVTAKAAAVRRVLSEWRFMSWVP
jgi:hypothetical protein